MNNAIQIDADEKRLLREMGKNSVILETIGNMTGARKVYALEFVSEFVERWESADKEYSEDFSELNELVMVELSKEWDDFCKRMDFPEWSAEDIVQNYRYFQSVYA